VKGQRVTDPTKILEIGEERYFGLDRRALIDLEAFTCLKGLLLLTSALKLAERALFPVSRVF